MLKLCSRDALALIASSSLLFAVACSGTSGEDGDDDQPTIADETPTAEATDTPGATSSPTQPGEGTQPPASTPTPTAPNDDTQPPSSGPTPTQPDGTQPPDDGSPDNSYCATAWTDISDTYADSGPLSDCDHDVVGSLVNVDDIVLQDGGETIEPCIAAKCDDTYVYIATNSVAHWGGVTIPQNNVNAPTADLVREVITRIPRTPTAVSNSAANAQDAATANGCVDAHNQMLAFPDTPTDDEPGNLCFEGRQTGYLYDDLNDGSRQTYQMMPCFGGFAVSVGGTPMYGPNEADFPNAYGAPPIYWPEVAGDDWGGNTALDLCGSHSHHHGINEMCYAMDEDNKPIHTYEEVEAAWDMPAMLEGECDTPSIIVGWSADGYPIKGPCVCAERDDDGACTDVRRTRSAWTYDGLGAWSDEGSASTDTDGFFDVEGSVCTTDNDCCTGNNCKYLCALGISDGGTAGSTVQKTCQLYEYSWCVHQFKDRTTTDTSTQNFIYLDRCNGFDGPDGYAYHATMSFPFIQACYRGEPVETNFAGMTGGGGGPPDGGPPGGGNLLPNPLGL